MQLLTSIRKLKSARFYILGGTWFLFGSPLTKCPIICTLNFMLNYPIIFELQADYFLEKFLDNGKYRTEKWRFVLFVSILTTCLCSKHKATLSPIFPFIILIKTYTLKLPGVLFSISLIIYNNLHPFIESIMSIYIHKLLKLPGLSCCARIKRAYVFCFKELRSFCKNTSHSARLRWTRTCEVLKYLLCHYSS